MQIATFPTASEIITGISAWSSAYFTELLPVIYIPLGVAVCAGLLYFLTKNGLHFSKSIEQLGAEHLGFKNWRDKTRFDRAYINQDFGTMRKMQKKVPKSYWNQYSPSARADRQLSRDWAKM